MATVNLNINIFLAMSFVEAGNVLVQGTLRSSLIDF